MSGAAEDILDALVTAARKGGADAVDATLMSDTSIRCARRNGKPEAAERSESIDIGLRVIIGKRQAFVSTTDTRAETLRDLPARAIAMARAVPEDPYVLLAQRDQLATQFPDLDMQDTVAPSMDKLADMADETEHAALSVPGITNTDGADASYGMDSLHILTSEGFKGHYATSSYGISVSVIAGRGDAMETGFDYDHKIHFADLAAPRDIGRRAGEDAAQKLNPRKIKTQQVPIIYDPRVSGGLVGHLASAINGASVARGTSMLKNDMGKVVGNAHFTIIDDPHIRRGLRSMPFDGEGLPTHRRTMVDEGILQSWFLDLASAAQLGLQSTGHAARGIGSPPSPRASNLYLMPGSVSPQDLIADIKEGFLVTDMMGSTINMLTGDYSRGASGFWIENGRISYPVSEVTIAGNLRDMWRNITPANDLVHRYGIDAPTVRVDGMIVAGQ